MPTVFGPSCGPRVGPEGRSFDYSTSARTVAAVSFLTEREALRRYLPPRFELVGEPWVTVEWTALHNLEWLAGRGYHMLGVKYQARYVGERDVAEGPFLAVLWEDRPEPILTGREELGFAKLYCELPDPRCDADGVHIEASWDGHAFLHMHLTALNGAPPPPQVAATSAGGVLSGTLHYRYVPSIAHPGEADIAQVVLTPAGGYEMKYLAYRRGWGRVAFVPTRWEQMPTMYHIVNALAELPVRGKATAVFFRSRGGKDLSDQCVLA